jgi:glycerol kinase
MKSQPVILSIDQGTTSTRTMAFDSSGKILDSSQQSFGQHFPNDGWVEHNPDDIWNTTLETCTEVIKRLDRPHVIAGIGITNQRETTILWDRQTGKPIYNAIVWQDRRTSEYCRQLKSSGHKNGVAEKVTEKTGLLLDPYFSATKIKWILENVPKARERAQRGELCFGTVDSFLIWKLTHGKVHATDATNASRTMLFNIHDGKWDADLLELFEIPESLLPEVKDSADDYGHTDKSILGADIPIAGVAGDQQAALVGQACFRPGMTKSTYGTGCFMVMNTGNIPVRSTKNLLTTIGYRINGKITYALEGSIFNAGTTIQWLRDELRLIDSVDEIEPLITQTPETIEASVGESGNRKAYLVPAFTGLGAPHWNADARGILTGLTRDTNRADIVRAAIEAVCYQTFDLMDSMAEDSSVQLKEIRVDGGMTCNSWMLQFLADILKTPVCRPQVIETTALGASYLAGLQLGIYSSLKSLENLWCYSASYRPALNAEKRARLLEGWENAVKQCLA